MLAPNPFFRVTLAAAMVIVATTAVAQDPIRDKARAILDQHRGAVITVQLVVNIQSSFPGFGSQQDEQRMEATGIIIDPEGLAVLSLNATDPTALIKRMGLSDMMDGGTFESRLSSAEYIMEDGSEIEAQLVLRDPDLDLAFFRPVSVPDAPMPFIDITQSVDVGLLDRLIVLNRLGRVTNRAFSVSIEWVEAVMERPRKFYIPGTQDTRSALGCPAFSEDGGFVGLLLIRAIRTSGGRGMFGRSDEGVTSVVLPAADIAELIPQAKVAEPEPMDPELPDLEDEETGVEIEL